MPGSADDKSSVLWKAFGMVNQGCVAVLGGNGALGAQILGAMIPAWRSTGATVLVPLNLSFMARAHAQLGQFEEGWQRISEALELSQTTQEALFEPELNRVAAEIAVHLPRLGRVAAGTFLGRGLAIARQQGARSWELRLALSHARLERDGERRAEARGLLASVYGGFTEGSDTADHSEARALLDELA
jgi:predicted ATPase